MGFLASFQTAYSSLKSASFLQEFPTFLQECASSLQKFHWQKVFFHLCNLGDADGNSEPQHRHDPPYSPMRIDRCDERGPHILLSGRVAVLNQSLCTELTDANHIDNMGHWMSRCREKEEAAIQLIHRPYLDGNQRQQLGAKNAYQHEPRVGSQASEWCVLVAVQ